MEDVKMKLIINSLIDETVKSSNFEVTTGVVAFWDESKTYILTCVHQIYCFTCLNHPTNEKEIKFRENTLRHSIDAAIDSGKKVYHFKTWEDFLKKETELPY